MRGVYTAYGSISNVAAAQTLLYLTTTSGHVVTILSAAVTNENNENNEQLKCTWQRITTLGTPTATTLTPSKQEPGDQASAATVKSNVTASEPTYTSNTEIGGEGWPTINGWFYTPAPEERLVVAPSTSIGLRLITATLTSVNLVVRVTYQEIG